MNTGYWKVEKRAGVHWLVSPAGERMVYTSVQCVGPKHGSRVPGAPTYDGIASNGGSLMKWVDETESRLKSWGLKGLGAWNHKLWRYRETPFTECLNIFKSMHVKGGLKPVYDADWAATVEKNIKPHIESMRDCPSLVGWFLDNEIPWRLEWIRFYFDGRKATDPNRREVLRFLKSRHRTIGKLNLAWGTKLKSWAALSSSAKLPASPDAIGPDARAFIGRVAKRFFAVTCALVRKYDRHRPILGVRYAGFPTSCMEVVAAQRGHTDVVSVNLYIQEGVFPEAICREAYRLTGQPIWVTEFAWHAPFDNRSGDRNTIGFGSRVYRQAARAKGYRQFVSQGASLPFVIGFDWFQWCDESPMGRSDGEDVNFGLVDIRNKPYELLVGAMARTNRSLPALHARSARNAKTPAVALPATPFFPVPELRSGVSPALLPALSFRPSLDPVAARPFADLRLGWRAGFLEVVADVRDAVRTVSVAKTKDHIEWFWMTDAVELMFRPGGAAVDSLDSGSVKIWAIPDGAGRSRPFVGAWRRHVRVFGGATGVRVTQSRVPGGYRLAFRIPPRAVGLSSFKAFSLLRFNALVMDCERVRELHWTAHQGDWTTERPKTWGRIALVP